MRLAMAALVALTVLVAPAVAQQQPVSIFSGKLNTLGYCQITNLAASTAIVTASCATGSVPANFSALDLIVEAQAIRYETNGSAPTAAIGMPLAVGTEKIFVLTNFANLRLIQQVAGAIVNLEFFGP